MAILMVVRFRLDRTGAMLREDSIVTADPPPPGDRKYHFNHRSFSTSLRTRNKAGVMMWIETPELLELANSVAAKVEPMEDVTPKN